MKTLIDFDSAPVFAIPLIDPVGQVTMHHGMLIEGPQGWGEFSPQRDDDDRVLARWLTAATEAGTVGFPDPVRGRVQVAVTVPAVNAARAHEIASATPCRTAAVEVGADGDTLADDIARLEAVRAALGPGSALRCDARGRWDVESAATAIAALDRAANGLEFVEQPCRTLAELAAVRRRVDVRIAADAAIREAEVPAGVTLGEAADIAILRSGPMGGARRALRTAEVSGLPCLVTSALETSVGLTTGLALAGALPELPYACELGARSLLAADLVGPSRSLVTADGFLPVAPMPPAPQQDLLGRYAVTEPERVAWWRERLRAAIAAA
ncbi:o-succinylbenzoate synthase [Mycobacterium sp. 21AC1]|uniref:o-succinylbenzoate synthase n=1 Tax=[Mycobacterium] appelbergii TaxID=2939269 RepID=UPI002938DC78|nr:o-succinylbenzoate synthase [Mycobacterium sp. 21AC1]MDV3126397.1 o-succinylbenzoate synthase [Mycobacterium sp. 21AC1]